MAPFEVIPAIDLRGGRVVRLRQGDFARETAYGDDPVLMAEKFAAAGVRWLHLVDLDGARQGQSSQLSTIREVVRAVGERVHCQVAGGLRNARAVQAALDTGARRIVLGTAALADPAFAGGQIVRHGPAAIVVALDVRNGRAVGSGWRTDQAGLPIEPTFDRLAAVGVEFFAVTAIERDGTLEGPDVTLLGQFVRRASGQIIASGGIGHLNDVVAIRELGCAGVIIGRALYEGRVDLAAALRLRRP